MKQRGPSAVATLKERLNFLKRSRGWLSVTDYPRLWRKVAQSRRELAERLGAISVRYRAGSEEDVLAASKYLDLNFWVLENVGRLFRLHLQEGRPRRVLDIGTGCGYFPYLCRSAGHQAECVDLDSEPLYNDVIATLGLKRHVRRIQKYEPLGIDGPFDLVTAFMICFNEHKQPGLWHIPEWKFFLDDVETRLNPGGKIFLSFNAETAAEPVNPELLRYLASRGGRVEGSDVLLVKR